MLADLKPILLQDIHRVEIVLTVEMPYSEFVATFGTRHSCHPPDWDAPGPVELWFFELPWGHRILLEYHLSISQFNIYVESLEIDSIMDYLGLRQHEHYIHSETIARLKDLCPDFTNDLCSSHLYRLDDNGNTVLMHTYESRRVAEFFRQRYESRGHKQLYWVESAN